MNRLMEIRLVGLVILLGCLIAANSQVFDGRLLGLNLYWITRLGIESALILAFFRLVEEYASQRSLWTKAGISIAASVIPFALLITAFDIVLGLPELELSTRDDGRSSLIEFALEVLYLSDNHIVLGIILTLSKELWGAQEAVEGKKPSAPLLARLDPPLDGEVQWVEAQEHYVRIHTGKETRMVLNRFSDVIDTLDPSDGMQVHRSHWVAFSAIAHRHRDGANLRLRLKSGVLVPVSRSFRKRVESAIPEGEPAD